MLGHLQAAACTCDAPRLAGRLAALHAMGCHALFCLPTPGFGQPDPLPPARPSPTAAAASGKEVLTLTGWAALAGVFALATVVLSGVVFGVRRWLGMGGNASRRGYTLVVKQELAHQGGRSLEEGDGGQVAGHGPPRRHG